MQRVALASRVGRGAKKAAKVQEAAAPPHPGEKVAETEKENDRDLKFEDALKRSWTALCDSINVIQQTCVIQRQSAPAESTSSSSDSGA